MSDPKAGHGAEITLNGHPVGSLSLYLASLQAGTRLRVEGLHGRELEPGNIFPLLPQMGTWLVESYDPDAGVAVLMPLAALSEEGEGTTGVGEESEANTAVASQSILTAGNLEVATQSRVIRRSGGRSTLPADTVTHSALSVPLSHANLERA